MTWVFSPPRGPFRSMGHTALRLRQNPVEPQITFKLLQLRHIKTKLILMQISSTGPPGTTTTRCCSPKLIPPWESAWEKKSGQLFAQSSQLKPPQCQELSWFRSLALVSYLLATSSWNTAPFYFTESSYRTKKPSWEIHVQVLSCFIGLSLCCSFGA